MNEKKNIFWFFCGVRVSLYSSKKTDRTLWRVGISLIEWSVVEESKLVGRGRHSLIHAATYELDTLVAQALLSQIK